MIHCHMWALCKWLGLEFKGQKSSVSFGEVDWWLEEKFYSTFDLWILKVPKLEMWVRFLGQEDPLEKEMATDSSILAWEILWTEELGGLQSMGSQRVRHDWSYSAHHKHPVTMATSVGCLCGDPLKSGKWTPCGYKHELPDLTGGPSSCTPNTPRNPLSQECLPVR